MNNKQKKIFIVIFLSVFFNLGAQEEGRPLRLISPDDSAAVYPLFTDHCSFTVFPLLTESSVLQPLTQQFITQYTNPAGVAYLNSVLDRARLYLPFIKEEVRKRGLPAELAYLPVIESSFVSTARSRSGAVGLWQFMMNSISPFNIRVTDMVDERRDFLKATSGALAKLDENYQALGCWELALAAYNCGLGFTRRAIQRTGVSDYWELSRRREFRQETINYVPKFLAAAYVLSQPRRFGINYWQEPIEWSTIPLNRQISLDLLAAESGTDLYLLRRMNAELLHGITPGETGFLLKVPAAQTEQINLVLERDDLRLLRYYRHVVRSGDTLWSLSRHFGVTLTLIEQHNPGISNRYLRVGESVLVPAFRDVPPPPLPVASGASFVPPAAGPGFQGLYVVQRGDTLWSLSRRYGINPQTLAEVNGMEVNEILREGRTLRVPIIE